MSNAQTTKNYATTAEGIAEIFGVAVGEPLTLLEGALVIAVTPDGKIVWKSNNKNLTPQKVAQILAYIVQIKSRGTKNKFGVALQSAMETKGSSYQSLTGNPAKKGGPAR